jgi:hypothetical protein
MRAVRVRRNTLNHDLDPEAAADLGDEPVEIKEPVETLVTGLTSSMYHAVITSIYARMLLLWTDPASAHGRTRLADLDFKTSAGQVPI